MELLEYTAAELSKKIKAHEITVTEAAKACLDRCRETEELNCFITIDEEAVYAQAKQIQRGIDEGRFLGALAGVPVAIKDNLCTKGLRTTCASKMLQEFVPSFTATAVENLQNAGMLILGKTNMDEFAMGNTSENSYFGAVRHPLNPEHVPGGSSGGSAAAVAAKAVPLAVGTDTGGSIRLPAAYCGAVGLKPTYGAVSRYGLIAYASAFDQIGPIARSVEDAAAALEVLASFDEKDSTSACGIDHHYRESLQKQVSGMKVGILTEWLPAASSKIAAAVMQAAEILKMQGAVVEPVKLALSEEAVPAYYAIATAQASSNLARFDGIRYGHRTASGGGLHNLYRKSRKEGFGMEVQRRILLGSYVLSAEHYEDSYLKALQVQRQIGESFEKLWKHYDLLLGPVSLQTAPKIGELEQDLVKSYQNDCYTVAANLAGIPALSLPFGVDGAGMPVGIQLMAGRFEEKKLLRAAFVLEQFTKKGGRDYES